MPTYVHPSGKKIKSDIPLSTAQLEEAFGMVESNPIASPVQENRPYSTGESISQFFPGVSKGFWDLAEGLKQRDIEMRGAWRGQPELETTKQLSDLAQQREMREPLPDTWTTKAGELLGGSLPPALVMPWGTGGGLLSRMGLNAIQGGLLGFAQPTEGQESVTGNIATGGVIGGLTPAVLAPVGKAFNAIKGVFPKVSDELIALSKKYNIPLSLGELKQNPVIQKAETWLEAIPFLGINGFRIKQNVSAEKVGKELLSKYIVNPDSPEIMSTNRAFVSGLYEDLKSMVGEVVENKIPVDQIRPVAQNLLKRYPTIFKEFQDTQREELLKNIVSGTEESVKRVIGLTPQRKPIFGETVSGERKLTFNEIWTLRDGLGEMIGQARKKFKSGEVDRTVISQLDALYAVTNKQIESWADSLGKPEITKAVKVSNQAYKDYVVKYRAIQDVMDKAEGIVGAGEIFSPKRLSTLLKDVLHKQNITESKLFNSEEIAEMTGLIKIMQTAKRGGQFMENPPTGNRWGIPQILSVGLGIPGGVAAGGSPNAALAMIGTELGLAGLGKFLTTNPIGKSYSLAASNLQPNSPQMLKILYMIAPKLSTTGALQNE